MRRARGSTILLCVRLAHANEDRACAGVERGGSWLCTHIKVTAPQALTVPVDLAAEAADSVPRLAMKILLGVALAAGTGIAFKGLWPCARRM
jgi:hypothetical protein